MQKILIVFFIYGLISCNDNTAERQIHFKNKIGNIHKLLEYLTDSIDACIDTSFHSRYRFKENKFYSYYIENNKSLSNFNSDSYPGCFSKILQNAKDLQIHMLWNNRARNYIQFSFAESVSFQPLVYVLRSKKDSAKLTPFLSSLERISERTFIKLLKSQ